MIINVTIQNTIIENIIDSENDVISTFWSNIEIAFVSEFCDSW